jgi:hypothetical protein
MTEVFAENAPLLVAAISIICGALVGRRFGSIVSTWIWAALLVLLLVLGSFVTAWLTSALISLGVSNLVASYTVIILLCLISGFAISGFSRGTNKP